MIARIWRGWTATECADRVAAELLDGIVARYATAAGNMSTELLRRPLAGGVELMILSLWDSPESAPPSVEETHRLLVARDTVAAFWELVPRAQSISAAAA